MTKGKRGKRGIRVKGALIRYRRADLGMSRGDVVEATGGRISKESLRNMEDDDAAHFEEHKAALVAQALNLHLSAIMRDPPSLPLDLLPSDQAFTDVEAACRKADELALPVIRSPGVPQDRIEEIYMALLGHVLSQKRMPLEPLLESWESEAATRRLRRTVPEPDLDVLVGGEFEKVTFRYGDGELVIENPNLLWDCSCQSRSGGEERCRIHGVEDGIGDEITARFSSGLVGIRYRNRTYYWRSSKCLWPPSVDAFSMFLDLIEDGVLNEPHKRILDLGSGTGFLGIAIAAENRHVTRLEFADWLLTPLLYSVVNWRANEGSKKHVAIRAHLGQGISWRDGEKDPFDLVVCNPPYLPLLEGFQDLGGESTVSGTDLLECVIAEGASLGRRVYVQFSDLAYPEAKAAADAHGRNLRRVGGGKWAPFRVRLALEKPEYLNLLVAERDLEVREGQNHRYWHRLQTYCVE